MTIRRPRDASLDARTPYATSSTGVAALTAEAPAASYALCDAALPPSLIVLPRGWRGGGLSASSLSARADDERVRLSEVPTRVCVES